MADDLVMHKKILATFANLQRDLQFVKINIQDAELKESAKKYEIYAAKLEGAVAKNWGAVRLAVSPEFLTAFELDAAKAARLVPTKDFRGFLKVSHKTLTHVGHRVIAALPGDPDADPIHLPPLPDD